MRLRHTFLLLAGLTGCSTSDTAGSDTAGSDTGGGDALVGDTAEGADTAAGDIAASDTAGPDAAGGDVTEDPDSATPILDRAPLIAKQCTAATPMTKVENASWYPAAMATFGGNAFVAQASQTLDLTKVEATASLGATVTLDPTEYASMAPDIAASSAAAGGAGVVWKHQAGDAVVRFARVGADGAMVGAAVDVEATRATALTEPRLAAASDGGFAMVIGVSDGAQKSTLRVVRLDANGASVGEPHDLYSNSEAYSSLGGVIAAVGDGFAVLFSTGSYDGSEVYFVRLDGSGAPVGEARRVSGAGGSGWSYGAASSRAGLAIHTLGGQVWAAWTEYYTTGGFENPTSHGILRLAALDDQGHGAALAVQAPVDGIQASSPRLFEQDGRLGLLWSAGTIIYICGGCIADDDLHVVLIDPAAAVPASAVVTFKHNVNGLVGPLVAPLGDDLVIGARLDYHALSAPAFGVVHCE